MNVFQVHAIDATQAIVVANAIKRANMVKFFGALPPCLIGIEACSSSPYWARELTKLGHLPAMSKRFINLTR